MMCYLSELMHSKYALYVGGSYLTAAVSFLWVFYRVKSSQHHIQLFLKKWLQQPHE